MRRPRRYRRTFSAQDARNGAIHIERLYLAGMSFQDAFAHTFRLMDLADRCREAA